MKVLIYDQTNIQTEPMSLSLQAFYNIYDQVKKARQDEEVFFDFTMTRFTYPLFQAMMLLLQDSDPEKYRFGEMSNYLQTIRFHGPLPATEYVPDNKTYIPILSISRNNTTRERSGETVSMLSKKVKDKTKMPNNVACGLDYVLQEIIDNFWEHSQAENAFILCQSFPTQQFIDVVIADNGITLLGSYQASNIPVKSDLDAMQMMVSAISSKDRPENESRGYGLSTSRKIITKGLAGQFICVSGSCVYIRNRDRERIISVPEWPVKGTVVAMRFYYNAPAFNYYNFIEY